MTPHELKTARLLAGLTQQQLADRMGVTRLTVSNWENGKHKIDRWKAQGLAGILEQVRSGK